MTLNPDNHEQIPAETVKVAQAAFPKGNAYIRLRDELHMIYSDEIFADLFPMRGQPAESPGRLALVTVLQFAEGLSDRQAADAVRSRIDWKYLLGLELSDPGFNYSVLSEFRNRLLEHGAEERLLDKLVELLKAHKLIKERGSQRTDSTHICTAARKLNRLEKVGETLRAALNSLADVAPVWLRERVPMEWYERYGPRVEAYRLPKKEPEWEAYAIQVGEDGYQLLEWAYTPGCPREVRDNPAIEILRRVWVQEYYREDDHTNWRKPDNAPRGEQRIQSPYDAEARYGKKREMNWVGYKAHFTETCDPDYPHLIVHVETTPAPCADSITLPTIHKSLADKQTLPNEHILDSGYISASHLVEALERYGVCMIGHPIPDSSWQSRANQGFEHAQFSIDWTNQVVTCPENHQSQSWHRSKDGHGNPTIEVTFREEDCQPCPCRDDCTRKRKGGRTLQLRLQAEYEALQKLRQDAHTEEFKQKYNQRAGVEGTISQGVRRCDLRRTRYVGQAKTHLHNLAIGAAINLARLFAWFCEVPLAQTRTSTFAALAVPTI
jgi:transposase